jgi:hypothetical protein
VREYGDRSGQSKSQVSRFRSAAEVACPHLGTPDLADCWRHLAEIHAAPAWLWPALVEAIRGTTGRAERPLVGAPFRLLHSAAAAVRALLPARRISQQQRSASAERSVRKPPPGSRAADQLQLVTTSHLRMLLSSAKSDEQKR